MRIVLELVMFFGLLGGVFFVNQAMAKERKAAKQSANIEQ